MPFFLVLPLVGVVTLVALAAHAGGKSRPRASAATHQFELDRGMPDDLVHEVLRALVDESDAAKLEALARSLGATFPLAASELRTKAASASSAPTRAPTSSPDRSEAATTLQAAMRAYAEETRASELEGFALSLRERYPTASLLLAARARELGGATITTTPPKPTTYVVRAGDTPTRIAETLAGDGRRWPELVEANPSKPRAHDGSFATLVPGETLSLPGTWPHSAAHSSLAQHAQEAAHA